MKLTPELLTAITEDRPVDWKLLARCYELSGKTITQLDELFAIPTTDPLNRLNQFNWWLISQYEELAEEFIARWAHKVDWNQICVHQRLSGEFMNHWHNKLGWALISRYQQLSEQFIDHWANRVSWYNVSRYQQLHVDLILRYLDKLDLEIIHQRYPEIWESYSLETYTLLSACTQSQINDIIKI